MRFRRRRHAAGRDDTDAGAAPSGASDSQASSRVSSLLAAGPRLAFARPPRAALRGRFRPPGDKSISHRAFIFGLLACGETRSKGCSKATTSCAPAKPAGRSGRRSSAWRRAAGGSAGPASARCSAPRDARFRQRRHRLAADDGRRRRPRDHRDLRRRRLAAQAADGPHPRPAAADGGRGPVAGRGRPLPDRAEGRARPGADPLPHARSPRRRSSRRCCSPASTRAA